MGFNAYKSFNWPELRRLSSLTNDEANKKIFLWQIVTSDSDASFSDLSNSLISLKSFPNMREVRVKIEKRIENYGLSPSERINFLTRRDVQDKNEPISGEGLMALASAYLELGKKEEAYSFASKAWHNYKFDSILQTKYFERFGSLLTPKDHDVRVDLLLWADRRTQAKLLYPYMSAEGRNNANLRLNIADDEGAVITGTARDDRAIKYERVKELRRRDRNSEALDLLLTINSQGLPEEGQDLLYTERRILLIEAIRSQRWNDAYKIASEHGILNNTKLSDMEFSSGWIALRFLKNPELALQHFIKFDKAVGSSMSKSRGYYWLGRTYEALNDQAQANRFFSMASQYQTFYYGQLAIARLANKTGQKAELRLPKERKATEHDWKMLNSHPLMKISENFLQIGERDLFVKFAFALDDTLTTEGEHQALSEYARSKGENLVGIRVAKAGLNRGIIATEAAFPFLQIPKIIGYNQAEPALTLAIARQESEFNTNARSRVGALGLMQFMPATAISQANKMDIPHQTSWLTSRPEHSLTLGSAHLGDLINNHYGSYILTAISYNAGPRRSIDWINTYGEVRGVSEDEAIDWVEKIPFSETRNYVQRILENTQVYRARLNGDTSPLNIIEDITKGVKPPPIFKVNIAPGADKPGGPPPEEVNSNNLQ